jgi:hypothetical protein
MFGFGIYQELGHLGGGDVLDTYLIDLNQGYSRHTNGLNA